METELPTIVDVEIGVMPKSLISPMPKISVTWDNGIKEFLFSYYPDEISFTKEELIGLTKEQALTLYGEKDRAYMRSST